MVAIKSWYPVEIPKYCKSNQHVEGSDYFKCIFKFDNEKKMKMSEKRLLF